jgi:hypothetical protein
MRVARFNWRRRRPANAVRRIWQHRILTVLGVFVIPVGLKIAPATGCETGARHPARDRSMTRIDQIKWKPDDRGRLRRMPARYIMRKDPNATAAYHALRKQGLSREEVEDRIERVSEANFLGVLFHEGSDWRDADHRPEIWLLLAEGMPVEKIPSLIWQNGRW